MDGATGRGCAQRAVKFHQSLIDQLYVFAEAKFDQAFRDTVNGSLDEHLDMLRRNGIVIDPSLLLPECPVRLEHLIDWYTELRVWTTPGLNGPAYLNWSDARAWAGAMDVSPRPSEWRIMMQLDQRYVAAARKHQPKDKRPAPRSK